MNVGLTMGDTAQVAATVRPQPVALMRARRPRRRRDILVVRRTSRRLRWQGFNVGRTCPRRALALLRSQTLAKVKGTHFLYRWLQFAARPSTPALASSPHADHPSKSLLSAVTRPL